MIDPAIKAERGLSAGPAVRSNTWLDSECITAEASSDAVASQRRHGCDYSSPAYYEDAFCTIYHSDCCVVLPHLETFDLLLADPPYGIGADSHQGQAKNGWKQYGKGGWDKEPPKRWVIEMAISRAKKSIVWGGNYFCLPPSQGWLIWDKGQRDFSLADCEMAWTSEDRATRIFEYARARAAQEGKEHPTQKPVPLMQWCIQQIGNVTSVLDPFAGVGTTGVAAKNLGIRSVLIEREERYCEIAARRLSQEVFDFAPAVAAHPATLTDEERGGRNTTAQESNKKMTWEELPNIL